MPSRGLSRLANGRLASFVTPVHHAPVHRASSRDARRQRLHGPRLFQLVKRFHEFSVKPVLDAKGKLTIEYTAAFFENTGAVPQVKSEQINSEQIVASRWADSRRTKSSGTGILGANV